MSEKKIANFVGINEKIAVVIKATANEGAITKVVEKRVEAEVTRRADLLEKALDKYNTAKKDLSKCTPDVISYPVVEDADGGDSGAPVRQAAYSEKKLKEKQNLQRLVADLDVAIMKAFSEKSEDINEGYIRLQKLIGNAKPEKQGESTE